MPTPAIVIDPRVNLSQPKSVTINATVVDINDTPISRMTYLFNNHALGNCISSGLSDATTGAITFQAPGVPNSTKFAILVDADGLDVNHVVHSQITGV